MSTGNFENWAGNIAELGAVYPFVGAEILLFILGMIFWIGWHVIQLREEGDEYAGDTDLMKDKDKIRQLLDT